MTNSKKFEELNPYKFNNLEKVYGGIQYTKDACENIPGEEFSDDDPFTYEAKQGATYLSRTTGLFGGDCSNDSGSDRRGDCDRSRRRMDNCVTDDVAYYN